MAEIDVIKQVFTKVGYIKEEQLMAIKEFVSGNDVFICLLTGYGKSLIYAALPDIFLMKSEAGKVLFTGLEVSFGPMCFINAEIFLRSFCFTCDIAQN